MHFAADKENLKFFKRTHLARNYVQILGVWTVAISLANFNELNSQSKSQFESQLHFFN